MLRGVVPSKAGGVARVLRQCSVVRAVHALFPFSRFWRQGLTFRGRPRSNLPGSVSIAVVAASADSRSTKQYDGFRFVK